MPEPAIEPPFNSRADAVRAWNMHSHPPTDEPCATCEELARWGLTDCDSR